MPPRIAVLASHVIQYQDPFFRLLAAEPELDLTVLYCSRAGAEVYRDEDMKTTLKWDLEMLQGYDYHFLRNFGFGDGYTRLINPGVIPAILRGHYDAVILFLGWGTITSLLAIAACRMTNTPFLLFGDSSFPPPAATFKGKMRAAFMRTIVRLTSGFLTSGKVNAEYYRHYGADPSRFSLVPWAIDNERFANTPTDPELRRRIGARDDQLVIVFSAKFIPRKDPMTLLRAVDAMRQRDRALVLFLGHGELRGELEAFTRERNLQVHFAGFINQADLPKYYKAGDVFVLPSLDEPRGSVLNEAMACGLPVIATDRVGAVGDIVLDGENAFVFEPGDVQALSRALDRLIEEPGLRERMAQRSRVLIADWDYAHGVRGVKDAVQRIARGER
ncbi:MAG TPA: glycosyltransferase family 4 protein [Thermoanaerobaculia bacterium]